MDHKAENKKAYNQYAQKFEEKFKIHVEEYVHKEADIFLTHLLGKEIIDLGSGPGNHALYLQERGYKVLCVDFSEAMLELCKEKGLNTKYMDLEKWDLPDNSLDGIWAYASLLHIPKNKIPEVTKNIKKTLKREGILGIAVKEGSGEDYDTNEKYPGTKRYFTYFNDEDIKKLFEKDFEVLFKSRRVSEEITWLFYLLKVRNKN